jgi:hypothetical protein
MVLGLTVAVAATAAGSDTSGWNGTRWGQKVSEVEALLQDATAPSEPEASDGLEERLVLPRFELAGFDYAVTLYFDPATEGLQRVSLQYDAKPPIESGRDAQSACGRVDDLLHKKYGPPTRNLRNGERVSGLFMVHRHWILPTTTIRLLSADSVEVGGFCSIIYEATKSPDMDKV